MCGMPAGASCHSTTAGGTPVTSRSSGRPAPSSQDLWKGRLVFLDNSGSNTLATIRYADLNPGAAPRAGGEDVFRAVPLWTTCANGDTYLLNPDSLQILRVSPDGIEDRLQAPLPIRPITPEDIRRYVALKLRITAHEEGRDTAGPEVRRMVEATIRDLTEQMPKDAPPVRMRCDQRNRLWIELFGTD